MDKINAAIYKQPEDSEEVKQSIGLLDIFGFENFTNNRLGFSSCDIRGLLLLFFDKDHIVELTEIHLVFPRVPLDFETVAALSSCASTLPMNSCSSSLSSMFSSWSRRNMPVKTLFGSMLTTKITNAPWTYWPTNLWTSCRSLMRRATSPRSVSSLYLIKFSFLKANWVLTLFFCSYSGHRWHHAPKNQSGPWEKWHLHPPQERPWHTVWNPTFCWSGPLWFKRYSSFKSNKPNPNPSPLCCSYCVCLVLRFPREKPWHPQLRSDSAGGDLHQ